MNKYATESDYAPDRVGGNGDPDCPNCGGRGVFDVGDGILDLRVRNCGCVYRRDLRANANRIYPELMDERPIESSPLTELMDQNVRIHGATRHFLQHLRHVVVRTDPRWAAAVVTDASLVTAWLATVVDVYDVDVAGERQRAPSQAVLTLLDLCLPPSLLIVQIGVKVAANKEAHAVLLEALYERKAARKPTWVWDTPARPFVHCLTYSKDAEDLMSRWEQIRLGPSAAAVEERPARTTTAKPSADPTRVLEVEDLFAELEAEDEAEDEEPDGSDVLMFKPDKKKGYRR